MTPDPSTTPATWVYSAEDERGTERLGRALAETLESGTVVALIGNLGAGKTRLVRSVAEAAGVSPHEINSPTFVLVHEYEGRWPIYHFDTYRLRDAQEFVDLGAEEYFSSAGVSFVEWADRVERVLPADHLRIEIATTGESSREFRLTATGPEAARQLRALAIRLLPAGKSALNDSGG